MTVHQQWKLKANKQDICYWIQNMEKFSPTIIGAYIVISDLNKQFDYFPSLTSRTISIILLKLLTLFNIEYHESQDIW